MSDSKTYTSCLEAATDYLAKGYSVIPVGRDKKPLISWQEFQNRLPTIEEVTNWYKQWSWAGVGIITGKISKLVVVDVDPRNGGSPEPYKKYNTAESRTGGGGNHFFFAYPSFDVPTIPNFLPGVDLKSDGGYVIVPPSIHPSGNKYEWQKHIFNVPLDLPDELTDSIKKRGIMRTSFDPDILQGVSEGARNESAASVIGKTLHGFREDDWETIGWNMILGWNLKNDPPMNERELLSVFRSIADREHKRRQDYSIPPVATPTLDVAETNFSPKILSWQEAIEYEEAGGEWLIENVLRPGWLAVIGGHGKHGKSTFTFHLLNSLRLGTDFIDKCIKPVPVIYINCEMALQDVSGLVRDVTSSNVSGGEAAKIVSDVQKPLKLDWLEKLLNEQEKAGVCVIDSFRGAFMLSGDSENEAGSVGRILRGLQDIARKTKWTIIVIHHFKKSGTGEALDLAGSGEWISAPDIMFTWSCPNFKEPGTLKITGRVPSLEPLSILLSRNKIEFLGTASEHQADSEREKVFNSITDDPQKSGDIAKIVELPDSTVRRRLAELLEKGEIARSGEGKKNHPFLWSKRNLPDGVQEGEIISTSNELKTSITDSEILEIFPGATIEEAK